MIEPFASTWGIENSYYWPNAYDADVNIMTLEMMSDDTTSLELFYKLQLADPKYGFSKLHSS